MSNWGFVLFAYGLTWLVLVGYFLYVARRSRRASAALERVSRDAQTDHSHPVEVKL